VNAGIAEVGFVPNSEVVRLGGTRSPPPRPMHWQRARDVQHSLIISLALSRRRCDWGHSHFNLCGANTCVTLHTPTYHFTGETMATNKNNERKPQTFAQLTSSPAERFETVERP
jgi:hypothetical protein